MMGMVGLELGNRVGTDMMPDPRRSITTRRAG